MIPLKDLIDIKLRPRSKRAFISQVPKGSSVLDIGCGNDSDKLFRRINCAAKYYGIDICPPVNDFEGAYIQSSPSEFNNDVKSALSDVDTVISAHNLEHCDDYIALVRLLAQSTNIKQIFLSFPSDISTKLPASRYGTLNFYQDSTHRVLPDTNFIFGELSKQNWKIKFVSIRYKPFWSALIGMLWWPIFKVTSIEAPFYGTYSFYGFETVIWAERESSNK